MLCLLPRRLGLLSQPPVLLGQLVVILPQLVVPRLELGRPKLRRLRPAPAAAGCSISASSLPASVDSAVGDGQRLVQRPDLRVLGRDLHPELLQLDPQLLVLLVHRRQLPAAIAMRFVSERNAAKTGMQSAPWKRSERQQAVVLTKKP